MQIAPLVIDISHHVEVVDFNAVQNAGVLAVISKATQGTNFVDTTYAPRRGLAKSVGLLWGAFHFCTGDDVAAQVDHFYNTAQPGPKTLMAVDFERNPSGPSMTLEQLRLFLSLLESRPNCKPVIYGGSYLRECLGNKADPALSKYPLWFAQYGQKPVLPPGWDTYWLWQYTDGKSGPPPHSIGGIVCDINDFNGTADDLTAQWPSPSGQSQIMMAAAVGNNGTPWMNWMAQHRGEIQQTGAKPTDFTESIFKHTDYGPLKGYTPASCAATVCAALEETGYRSTHSAAADSYLDYGDPSRLEPGCVVVYKWPKGGYHVDFCDQVIDQNTVRGLGGNQGHMLKDSDYSRQYIVATRWPVR